MNVLSVNGQYRQQAQNKCVYVIVRNYYIENDLRPKQVCQIIVLDRLNIILKKKPKRLFILYTIFIQIYNLFYKLNIILQVISEPCFNILRTKEQLGKYSISLFFQQFDITTYQLSNHMNHIFLVYTKLLLSIVYFCICIIN